jgi:hypothetical protein
MQQLQPPPLPRKMLTKMKQRTRQRTTQSLRPCPLGASMVAVQTPTHGASAAAQPRLFLHLVVVVRTEDAVGGYVVLFLAWVGRKNKAAREEGKQGTLA